MNNTLTQTTDSYASQLVTYVREHPALHSRFMERFEKGECSKKEIMEFVGEFYHLTRVFPAYVCTLMVNAPFQKDSDEMAKILATELGEANSNKRHEKLYQDFLSSIEMDAASLRAKGMSPQTQKWLSRMHELYAHSNSDYAMGASFAMEHLGTPLWKGVLNGMKHYAQFFPDADLTYFHLHQGLEVVHEDATEETLAARVHDGVARADFERGAQDLLENHDEFMQGFA
jgi:pyrroloquinoline quinone (PQQ) biosynthesis protein C